MTTTRQIELKLLEEYDDAMFGNSDEMRDARLKGQKYHQLFLRNEKRKLELIEKQLLKCQQLFPGDKDLQVYEFRLHCHRALAKMGSAVYYDLYPSMFSPSKDEELRAAIKHFDDALQIRESPRPRMGKVMCYQDLGDNKSALRELEVILERHKGDEEDYLWARKEKDELEMKMQTSSVGQFVRGLFGRI